jgi:DNA-binding transcriptional MerR regulator
LQASGGKELQGAYLKLIERKFQTGDTDVARKNLFHWEKENLLPYKYDGEGWRKFSLIEFAWLKIITALRDIGVPLEKIKEIKSQLFVANIEDFKAFFIEVLQSFSGELKDKESVIKLFKRRDIPEKMWKETFDNLQISNFSILVLQILLYRQNLCLIIDENNKTNFVTLGQIVAEKRKINDAYLGELMNQSFTLINIRKIISQFFDDEKIDHENDFLLAFLNKHEKIIIAKIREGHFKEIKIRFKDDQPIQIDLTKSVDIEESINKVSRILKKGEFQDIRIRANDGKLTYYEQTDIVKLK